MLYMLDATSSIDRFPTNTSIRGNKILQPVPNYTDDFESVSNAISLRNRPHRHRHVPMKRSWTDVVDPRIYSTICQRSIVDDVRVSCAVSPVRFRLFPVETSAQNNKIKCQFSECIRWLYVTNIWWVKVIGQRSTAADARVPLIRPWNGVNAGLSPMTACKSRLKRVVGVNGRNDRNDGKILRLCTLFTVILGEIMSRFERWILL